MSFEDAFLGRLKGHPRVPDVLAGVLEAWRRQGTGDSYTARVPWRPDEHPSLNVWRSDGTWLFKDTAHGDTGDMIALIRRMEGLDFPSAVEWLAQRLGEPVVEQRRAAIPMVGVEERLEGLAKLYERAEALPDGCEGAEYLRGRGLLDVARSLAVRCFEPGNPALLADARSAARLGMKGLARWISRRRAFLVYPATVEGRPVVHRARLLCSQDEAREHGFGAAHWTPPTTGGLALPALWPTLPEELPQSVELVLTEGETDALAVRVLVPGLLAFAVLGASRFGPKYAEFSHIVTARAHVVLAFQGDEASRKSARRLRELFAKRGVEATALVPSGGATDWAEALAWGTSGASSLVEVGAPLDDYSLGRAFADLRRHTDDLKAGRIVAVPVPWRTLGWALGGRGIPPKSLGVLSSRTGVGKSWMALRLAVHVAGGEGEGAEPLRVLYVNTELHLEAVAARLLAVKAGCPAVASMTRPEAIEEATFDWQRELDRLPLEITDPEPRSLGEVLDMLREGARGCGLLIVDHIGDLDCGGKRPFEALPDFARSARGIAQASGAAILLVTHLRSGEEGDVLAFSRQVENVADYSWALRGFEPRRAVCVSPAGNIEREINRILVVRKSRYGPSDLRVAMELDGDTLELLDLGRFLKWAKGDPK